MLIVIVVEESFTNTICEMIIMTQMQLYVPLPKSELFQATDILLTYQGSMQLFLTHTIATSQESVDNSVPQLLKTWAMALHSTHSTDIEDGAIIWLTSYHMST